ncbi:MAG: hypothetical protein HY393_04465 [Candidatus Diapherotrites archaeon]|nr:hypothetical protein [Candidatus Diapherotrites archaeon]
MPSISDPTFTSSALPAEPLSKHKQRLLRLQERKAERVHALDVASAPKWKEWLPWIAGFLVMAGLAYGVYVYFSSQPVAPPSDIPFPVVNIHWHADLEMDLCGVKSQLPAPPAGTEHLGSPIFHTHEDRRVHMEGSFYSPNDLKLGVFMDLVGVPFSSIQIASYKAGDQCPSSNAPGKVSMTVNGISSTAFREYVIHENDKIVIAFA